MNSYDVVVVGAGPAGSSAAFFLGKGGAKVLLIDKEHFPRDKLCAGAISPRSLKILEEMRIVEEIETKEFQKIIGIRIFSPKGGVSEGRIPKTEEYKDYGYVTPRIEFDEILRRSALTTGVQFINEKVLDLIIKDGYVRGAKTQKNYFESKITILAAGANSYLSRQYGFLMFLPENFIVTAEEHFDNVAGLDNYIDVNRR